MNRISGKKLKWLVFILAACLLINTWSAASSVRTVYAAEEGGPTETLAPEEEQEDTEPGGQGQEDTGSPEGSSDVPQDSDTEPQGSSDTPSDTSDQDTSPQENTEPQPGESSQDTSDSESDTQPSQTPEDTEPSADTEPSETQPSETQPSETEPQSSADQPEDSTGAPEVESSVAPTISDIPEDPDYLQIGDYRLKLSLTDEEPPEGFFAAYDIHTFQYSVHCFFSTNYREYVYVAEKDGFSGNYVYDEVNKTLIPFVMAEEDGGEHPYMVLPLKGTENIPGQILGEGQVPVKDTVTGNLIEVPCLYVQDISGSQDTLFCLKSYSGTSDYYVVLENEAGNTVFLSYNELDERLREVEEEMTKTSSDETVLPSSESVTPSSSESPNGNKNRNSLLLNYKLWLGIIIFVILVLIIAIIIVFRMSRKQDEEEEEIEEFERSARRRHDIMNQPGGTESGYNNHYSDEPEPFDISFEDSFPEEMEVAISEAKKDYSHVESFARPQNEDVSDPGEAEDLSSSIAAAEEEVLARDPDLEPLFEDAEEGFEDDDDIPLIDSDDLDDVSDLDDNDTDLDLYEEESEKIPEEYEDDAEASLEEDSEYDDEDEIDDHLEDNLEDGLENDYSDEYYDDEESEYSSKDHEEYLENDTEDDIETDSDEDLGSYDEVDSGDVSGIYSEDGSDISIGESAAEADIYEEDDLVQDLDNIAEPQDDSEEVSSSDEIPEDPWKGFRFADDAEVEVVRKKPIASVEETDDFVPAQRIRTKYIPLEEEDDSLDELKLDEIIMTSHAVEKTESEAEPEQNISSRSKRLNEEQELRKYVDSFIAPKKDIDAEETSSSGDDFEEIHLTED